MDKVYIFGVFLSKMGIEEKTENFLVDYLKMGKVVPKEIVIPFEQRFYRETKQSVDENNEWARYSIEKSFSYVFL